VCAWISLGSRDRRTAAELARDLNRRGVQLAGCIGFRSRFKTGLLHARRIRHTPILVLDFRRLNRVGRHRTSQQHPGLLADHNCAAFGGREPRYQADLFLRSAGRIPRQPKAIGVTGLRLAVVFGELLGREDKLAVRHRIGGVALRFIEGIDDEVSARLDRLLAVLAVEHHPPAKAALGRLLALVHDGLAPHADELERRGFLAEQRLAPGNVLVQVELRAARDRGQ